MHRSRAESPPVDAPTEALMRAIELNLARHAAHLHPDVPGAVVRRVGDFQISDSGLGHDTYNIISRVAFDEGFTESALAEIAGYVRSSGRPFSWWIADGEVAAAVEPALAELGFHATEREDVMILRLADAILPTREGAAEVITVRTPAELAQYAGLLAANWDPPADDVIEFLRRATPALHGCRTGGRFLLRQVDGVAASGAEVFLSDGVAGIYGVATRAAYRGRGLATDVLTAALRDLAAAGEEWAVLQATADGSSIYRRFGFRSVGTCTEFALV
jgi:ribosomal protein S18 acetylase RimI-like enzyme